MSAFNFNGFNPGKTHLTPIPSQFFQEVVPQITDINELKLVLHAFWLLSLQEGNTRFVTRENFLEDEAFLSSFEDPSEKHLELALEKAVFHKILIQAHEPGNENRKYFFLNSARGRSLSKAVSNGKWVPDNGQNMPQSLEMERPNIFQLYEENIGPLTPIITDMLREAEEIFPASWIEEAISIAIKRNIRNWRYIEAILESRQEEGKHEENKRSHGSGDDAYFKGKYDDIIER